MAGDTVITVVGNLTADPELRFTQQGIAVASFTVASTPRQFDRASGEWKDGEALFLRCSVWRDVAENVAESLEKGSRVIVQGRLRQRSYQTREGENRTSYEIDVDEIGPSLRYATAKPIKQQRGGGGYGNRSQGGGFGGGQNAGGQGNQGNQGGNYGNQGAGSGFGGNQGGNGGGFGGGQNAGGGDPWAGAGSNNYDDPPF